MNVVQVVRYWNVLFVETVVSGFITANKQYRNSSRVKGIENSNGPATALNSQFSHS